MKQILSLLIISTVYTTSFSQIPFDSLMVWYPFNRSANDATGNGYNGVVNGATLTTDRFGNSNSAYYFNGSAYISVSSFPVNTNHLTVSFWFNTPDTTLNQRMLTHNWPVGSFSTDVSPQNGFGAAIRNGIGGQTNIYGTFNPRKNTWYNYILTYNGDNLNLYVNGLKINSIATTIGLETITTTLFFGGNQTYYFDGSLDDIRVYNKELDSTEVQALFNEGLCTQSISVTDTLRITTGVLTSFNPLTYSNSIKVYPNPTKDHITIDFGNYSALSGYTLKITNSLGNQVYSTSVTQQQSYVSLSNWGGNGLYFVYVIDGQGNTLDVKKIVLQ